MTPATAPHCPLARRGPKPSASARPAPGGRFPPAGSGAGLCWCGFHGSWWQRSARAGKRGSRFLFPPGGAKAVSPLLWQGPSPLPQCYIGIRTSRGPQPPASARPAPGGRFSPAGSGAGLCWSRTCRSVGRRLARAGETRVAFPVSARRRGLKMCPCPRPPPQWQRPSPLPLRHAAPPGPPGAQAPAGGLRTYRVAGAMAPARPCRAHEKEGPVFRPSAHAAGSFSADCQCRAITSAV